MAVAFNSIIQRAWARISIVISSQSQQPPQHSFGREGFSVSVAWASSHIIIIGDAHCHWLVPHSIGWGSKPAVEEEGKCWASERLFLSGIEECGSCFISSEIKTVKGCLMAVKIVPLTWKHILATSFRSIPFPGLMWTSKLATRTIWPGVCGL